MEIIIIIINPNHNPNNILMVKIMLLIKGIQIILAKLGLVFHQIYMEARIINQNPVIIMEIIILLDLVICMEVIIQIQILLQFIKFRNKKMYQVITNLKIIQIINILQTVQLIIISKINMGKIIKINRNITIKIKTHHQII